MRENVWVLLCIFWSVIGVGVSLASGQERVFVESGVRETLERQGTVRVYVSLRSSSDHSTSFSSLEDRCSQYANMQSSFLEALPDGLCSVRYRYRYSPTLFVELYGTESLDSFSRSSEVEAIRLDARGGISVKESMEVVGANRVFSELDVTGRDSAVAILDAGIDSDHPDLVDALVYEHHFLDMGLDTGPGAEDSSVLGHGINVSGIVASRGVVAPRGVAPDAKILAIKVLDNDGMGWVSDWAAAVEHVVQLHETGQFRVDVIQMSFGTRTLFASICDDNFPAFSGACRAAVDLGIACVSSSGNQYSTSQLEAPGCFSSVISVSSVLDTDADVLSDFANRGLQLDLLAPGEVITSSGPEGGVVGWRGTSQAAPHVTGLICLLREVSPGLGPGALLQAMKLTGVPVFDEPSGLTFPRVDAYSAVTGVQLTGDCNANEVPDALEIFYNQAADCDANFVPDECQIASEAELDCDLNGVLDSCQIAELLACRPHVLRGDADFSGAVDVSDAIHVLKFIFLGDPRTLSCLKNADANDDSQVDISDPLVLLRFLLLGGEPPALPYPNCGEDPTPDHLACEVECERN